MTTYQDLGYDKIFVSLDGTEAQAKVLDRAIIMAANHNAELYIGHVIDSTALETAGTYPVDLIAALEKSFRSSIADQIILAENEPNIKKVEVIVKAGRIRETLKDEMLDVIHPRPRDLRCARALLDQVCDHGLDFDVSHPLGTLRYAGHQIEKNTYRARHTVRREP